MKIFVKRSILFFALFIFSALVSARAINVNTASAEEISDAMSGVGMVKAQAIVDDRKLNGQFKTLNDVARVKGIGLATIEKNRESVVAE